MQGYKAEISEDEKEGIIKELLPFIKYTANRLSLKLPPQLTTDDLISAGLIGLLDAIERFEYRGAKLKTFAEHRIKGAMLDEIRAAEWTPRSVKKKANEIKNAFSKLERQFGRLPMEEEVADEMGISLEQYHKTLQQTNKSTVYRFEELEGRCSYNEDINIMECIPDSSAENAISTIQRKELEDILKTLIDELPEKERLLLSLYYWEELTMKEIANILNITEGRVCQLHNQALIRIRAKIESEKIFY